MDFFKDASPDHGVEVGLHKLENEVDITIVFGAMDVVEFDDVRVIEFIEEHDLAEGALRVGGVLKGVENLLESDGRVLAPLVDGSPNLVIIRKVPLHTPPFRSAGRSRTA